MIHYDKLIWVTVCCWRKWQINLYKQKKSYNFVDDGQHVEVASLPQRLIQIQVLSKSQSRNKRCKQTKDQDDDKNLCKKTREFFFKNNDFRRI